MPTSPRLTLAFGSLAHACTHALLLFYATLVLSLQSDWGLGYAELMALSVPGGVLLGLGALPAGWLADRWSGTGMLAVFFVGLGLTTIATGLAQGPIGMALGLSGMGLFAAIYHPVGVPWVIEHAVNRGRALAINGVFGTAGTAAAALIAAALAQYLGWRWALLLPGFVVLLLGLGFIACWRLGLLTDRRTGGGGETEQPRAHRRRAFAVLAVTAVCGGLVYQATSYALPKLFEERLFDSLGGSLLGIGGAVTAVYVVGAGALLLGGELADRLPLKTVYVACLALQTPFYFLAFLLASPILLPVAAMMVSANFASSPVESALLARYAPRGKRSQTFGLVFLLNLGIGAVGLSLLPILHKLTGEMAGLFAVLAAFSAVAVAVAFRLPAEPAGRLATVAGRS